MNAPASRAGALPREVEDALRRLLGLAGSAAEMLARHGDAAPDAREPATDGVHALEQWLYGAWYCADPQPTTADGGAQRDEIVSLLRSALPAAERWQAGWIVLGCHPDGSCVAAGRGEQRTLRPGDYANLGRPGLPPVPGDGLLVSERLDWLDDATGFWCARSPVGEAKGPLARLYCSVRPGDAPHVLRALCTLLDDRHLPYALKCPGQASAFVRVDSLVVYLERETWPAIAADVHRMASEIAPRLRPGIPPLTLPIGQGVAFAEDPGGGDSFGSSRCRALAPGVLALTRDPAGPRRGIEILCDALRAAGIDPSRPWLCERAS